MTREARLLTLAKEHVESIHLHRIGYFAEGSRARHSHPFSTCEAPDCVLVREASAPPAAETMAPVIVVQNWFAKLGMTKDERRKQLNWDDCEHLLRQLAALSAGGDERKETKAP